MILFLLTTALAPLALELPSEPVTVLRAPLLAKSAGGEDPTRVRYAPVLVDRDALRGAESARFTLFDGEEVLARRERFGFTARDGFTWYGSIEGDPHGFVMLAVREDAVAGTVRTRGDVFKILGTPGGGLELSQHDLAQEPPCGTTEAHVTDVEASGPAPDRRGSRTDANGDTVVDVGVVWTPAARQGAGGLSQVRALVDLAVLETNVAYDQSNAPLDVRLVFAREVNYVESSSFNTDLDRLRRTNDGFMDEVHRWRDNTGADAVSLFVNTTQFCGIAHLMATPSVNFADRAFSVVARTCATGNYSFGHELGHNYGSAHDRANWGANPPSNPFAYGYRTPNGTWRTIMAIFQGSRIQYFSSPDASFMGFPLGIEHPDPESADNALSFELNAPFISAWRPTVGRATAYGCGVNPAQSIGLLNEQVAIGGTTAIGLDNPLGTQGPNTVALLALSLQSAPGFPCGVSVPGFGMTAPGSAGELLIALGSSRLGSFLQGPPWGGPGNPSVVSVSLPNDPMFIGLSLYAQGVMFDPAATFGIRTALTDAVHLEIGEL